MASSERDEFDAAAFVREQIVSYVEDAIKAHELFAHAKGPRYFAEHYGQLIAEGYGRHGRLDVRQADTPTPERLRAWAEWLKENVGTQVIMAPAYRTPAEVALWLADALESTTGAEEPK